MARRVAELGRSISDDYARLSPDEELVLLPVLAGGIVFVADLMRAMPLKLHLNVVTVTSYPDAATSTVGSSLVGDLPADLEGKHVLVVDDILDSGGTVRLLRAELKARGAWSVRVCVLLRKERPAALDTPVEYVGFDIPDLFVVGYGLDYDNLYRNLPHVAVLLEETT